MTYNISEDVLGVSRTWTITTIQQTGLKTLTDPLGYKIDVYPDANGGIGSISDKWEDPQSKNWYDYEYDTNGRLETVTDPKSRQQTFEYLPLALAITKYTDVRGTAYRWYFDSSYNIINESNPMTYAQYHYNSNRKVTLFRDGSTDREWTYTYDTRGNLLTSTDPLNNQQEWHYEYTDPDYPDKLVWYDDGENNRWEYAYADPTDPTAVTIVTLPVIDAEPPSGRQITMTYYASGDGKGQVAIVTDANGVQTEFLYEATGQLYKEIEGETGGSKVYVEYDFDDGSRLLNAERKGSVPGLLQPEALAPRGNTYDLGNRLTNMNCDCEGNSPAGPESSHGCSYAFSQLAGDDGVYQYDPMNRVTFASFVARDHGQNEDSDVEVYVSWDEVGRLWSLTRKSEEPLWRGTPPAGMVERQVAFDYTNWETGGVIVRETPDGLETTYTYDSIGRLADVSVKQPILAPVNPPKYSATYTYFTGRNLVQYVDFGNDTRVEYDYDHANRVTLIKHSDDTGAYFLEMDYQYDGRNLVTQITESDGDGQSSRIVATITFEYDSRGRLIRETRSGVHADSYPYDLSYAYDQGGNRTLKVDLLNDVCTTYDYDVDDPQTYGSELNRLMAYDMREMVVGACDDAGDLIERVEYTYADVGPAAGNPIEIRRTYTAEPFGVDVTQSSCLWYNQAGELWIVTQRSWWEAETPTVNTEKIWEFRGSGRERYMVRERDVDSPHDPIYDEAVWTDYFDNRPIVDYTVDDEGVVTEGLSYMLGVSQYDPTDDVSYLHGDQVSTTRHMTDDTGAVARSMVTTAFGEPVYADGTVGTRYGYAGAHGYESFDALDWGTDVAANAMGFPYLHVGYRWYSSETGRFLERDPIGIEGGYNVYAYVNNSPVQRGDSFGLFRDDAPPVNDDYYPQRPKPRPTPKPRPPIQSEFPPNGGGQWEGPRLPPGSYDDDGFFDIFPEPEILTPEEEMRRLRKRIRRIKDGLTCAGAYLGALIGGPPGALGGAIIGTVIPNEIEDHYLDF